MLDPYEIQHKPRFDRIISEIDLLYNRREGVRILDYGCHMGTVSVALKKIGYDVSAVDVSSEIKAWGWRYAEHGIEHDIISGGQTNFGDEYFDCIVFGDVLEHLWESPLKYINELKRLLKPSGAIVLTTPNAIRFENRVKMLFGVNIYQDLNRYIHYPRSSLHYREYVKKDVVDLLEFYAGFSVIKAKLFDVISARSTLKRFIQKIGLTISTMFPSLRNTIIVIARKP